MVSISYEFLLKAISEQTLVQVFFKDTLIFKEPCNIDPSENILPFDITI